MKNLKEFILEKIVEPVYENLTSCEKFTENEYELSLPLFLNTGDAVDIIIEYKDDEKIILKNRLYLLIEEAFKNKINYMTLRKKYFFNNEKIKVMEKKYIVDNGINNTLLQEKEILCNDLEKLKKDFFFYIFRVMRYNNYIYDYIISNLKPEERKESFSKEMERFVKNYNIKNKLELNKLNKNEEENIASENNDYYIGKEKLLTGVNDKIHFLEAVRDIEVLKKKYSVSDFIIVQSIKGKNGLTETYMKKFIKAKYEYFNNNLELGYEE